MRVITFPNKIDLNENEIAVFLGGNVSENNWQKEVINFFEDLNMYDITNLVILNPGINNDVVDTDKVIWEFRAITECDILSFYFCKSDYNDNDIYYNLGKYSTIKSQKIIGVDSSYDHSEYLKALVELYNKEDNVVFNSTPEAHAKRIYMAFMINNVAKKLNGKVLMPNGDFK